MQARGLENNDPIRGGGRTQGVLADWVDGVHIIATGGYSPAFLAGEPVIIAKGCNGKDMSIVHCLNSLKTGEAKRFLCRQGRAGRWNTLERGYDLTYQGRPSRPAALLRSQQTKDVSDALHDGKAHQPRMTLARQPTPHRVSTRQPDFIITTLTLGDAWVFSV